MKRFMLITAILIVLASPLVFASPIIEITPASADVKQGGETSYTVKVTANEPDNYWVDATWTYGGYSSSGAIRLKQGQSYIWNIPIYTSKNTPTKSYQVKFSISNKWNAYSTLNVLPSEATPLCSNECFNNGAKTCSGGGYVVCGNYDFDNCLEWSSVNYCGPGKMCSGGGCVNINPPEDFELKQSYILDLDNGKVIDSDGVQYREIFLGEVLNFFAEVKNHGGGGEYTVVREVFGPNDACKKTFSDKWYANSGEDQFSWRSISIDSHCPAGQYTYKTIVNPGGGSLTLGFYVTKEEPKQEGCSLGEKICEEGGYKTCGDFDGDGDNEWSLVQLCEAKCGEFNENFCSVEGDVVMSRTCTDKVCQHGSCSDSSQRTEMFIVEECEIGCKSGTCDLISIPEDPKGECEINADCGSGFCGEWGEYLFDKGVGGIVRKRNCYENICSESRCGSETTVEEERREPEYVAINISELQDLIDEAKSNYEVCDAILNDSLPCEKKLDFLKLTDDFLDTIGKDEVITLPAQVILPSLTKTSYVISQAPIATMVQLEDGSFVLGSVSGIKATAKVNNAGKALGFAKNNNIFPGITILGAIVHGASSSDGDLADGVLYFGGDIATALPILAVPKLASGVTNWILLQFGATGQEKASEIIANALDGNNWVDCVFNKNSKSMEYCWNKGSEDISEMVDEAVSNTEIGIEFIEDFVSSEITPDIGYEIVSKNPIKPGEEISVKIKIKHIKSLWGTSVKVKMDLVDPLGNKKSFEPKEVGFNIFEYGTIKSIEFSDKAPEKIGDYNIEIYSCVEGCEDWEKIVQGKITSVQGLIGERCIVPEGCKSINEEGPKNSLACSDGFDNDGDGLIDSLDQGCK